MARMASATSSASSVSATPATLTARDLRMFRRRLLAWYDREARTLPWRARGGRRASAYRVLVSEMMLQQTRVAVVAGRYRDFVRRWPGARSLAAASEDEVLAAWSGLGYYARARNLHRAVCEVVSRHGGRFPRDLRALRRLPGVGEYTASALAALAFDEPVVAVDGNVRRVASRLFAFGNGAFGGGDGGGDARRLDSAVQGLVLRDAGRHGDFAQALMELGALVCRPRSPLCGECPVSGFCAAYSAGRVAEFPVRAERARRDVREGRAWVVEHGGRVLLVARGRRGLLGGMFLPPLEGLDGDGDSDGGDGERALLIEALSARISSRSCVEAGEARHIFTHVDFRARVYGLRLSSSRGLPRWLSDILDPMEARGEVVWLSRGDLHAETRAVALPRLTIKLIETTKRDIGH